MSSRNKQGMFSNIGNDLIAALVELIGTTFFLLFAFGAVQVISVNLALNDSDGGTGTQPQGSDSARLLAYYYISAAFGLSLFAVASIFFRVSGSMLNPSAGLALMLVGAITPVRFVLASTAQMLGGIIAAALVDGLTPGSVSVGVALAPGVSKGQGLVWEAAGTCVLILSILFLAAEKHAMTPFAPLGFGFMLFAIELSTVPYTGGAVNTARAFGPACIEGFDNYHWIYWLGPTLGALLAVGIYYLTKKANYWEVNPNQDSRNSAHAPDLEMGN